MKLLVHLKGKKAVADDKNYRSCDSLVLVFMQLITLAGFYIVFAKPNLPA